MIVRDGPQVLRNQHPMETRIVSFELDVWNSAGIGYPTDERGQLLGAAALLRGLDEAAAGAHSLSPQRLADVAGCLEAVATGTGSQMVDAVRASRVAQGLGIATELAVAIASDLTKPLPAAIPSRPGVDPHDAMLVHRTVQAVDGKDGSKGEKTVAAEPNGSAVNDWTRLSLELAWADAEAVERARAAVEAAAGAAHGESAR